MTKTERESIIGQLALITGYHTQYYESFTDEELQRELETIYE